MTVKYVNDNGIRKLNPDWRANSQTIMVPFQNRNTALPVVSYPTQQNIFASDEEIIVTPSYEKAARDYHKILVDEDIVIEPEITVENPSSSGNHHGLGQLAEVLAKFEIPAGMLAKLLGLRNFEVGEIIVDDSSSMNAATDARGAHGEHLTRWEEAQLRILQMMELIAHATAPKMMVRFLNRNAVLELHRQPGEAPVAFFERVQGLLQKEFSHPPNGLTPALERIEESLARYKGIPTLRYFMGDGVPNGGAYSAKRIADRLVSRADPEKNPFTFISCTNNDADTEWMKDCEEIAPYCSEFDDYLDESREILKDQGRAFPYSYGLHLVGQLVAAFNPHDLDALDESVPLTKSTMEDLLGYSISEAEYKYYFDSFLEAQGLLQLRPDQRSFVAKLPGLFPLFCTTSHAADIPEVAEYRLHMKSYMQEQARARQLNNEGYYSQAPQDECCKIL